MAHFLIFTFERFLAQHVHKLFKSLLAIIFNNLLKYANYAFIVYMCTQIKKLSHNIFSTTFSIVLTPSDPFYKLNSVLTFCYLEYMLPLLLFAAMYPMSPILHFVAFSHVITFIFTRCATLDGKSLYDFFQLFSIVIMAPLQRSTGA